MIKAKILGGFFSSTMWFGFLIMLMNWLNNNTALLQGLVPEQYDDLVLYGVGLIIWLLRWITTKPIEDKLPRHKDPLTEALNKELDGF